MLGIILTVSTIWDMYDRKIPNAFIIAGMMWELWSIGLSFLSPFLVVLTVGFILFHFGMMGAGDIKLMALVAGGLGCSRGLYCIGLAWLIGAGISLIKLINSKTLFFRFSYFFSYFRRLFQTKKLTPYYDQNRDGYGPTIRFSIPLATAYLLLFLSAAGKGGSI